jgi:hypothetical protein
VIDPKDADEMAAVLAAAAEASPLRQVRSELNRRAAEWRRAASDVAMMGEDWEIDLAGCIAPGDRVLVMSPDFTGEVTGHAGAVVRVIHRDGQTSLHLSHPESGRDVYQNFCGPTSPVVVRL